MMPYQGLKKTASAITIVGALFYGAWSLDIRYAKAADVQAQIGSLTILYLQSILMDLKRQLFDLLVAEETRRLTNLEKRRMIEIEQEITITELKIRNGGS